MLRDILMTIAHEFSDLSLPQATQLMVRLLVAALMGGLLGWERERADKPAGLRTHILVAMGSAAFVAIPSQIGNDPAAQARILGGLISGIGFLGAGCIIKSEEKGRVEGLTTAAGIWLTAGVGVAAGLGRDASSVLLGVFGVLTLSAMHRLEGWIKPYRSEGKGGDQPAPHAD